MKCTETDAQSPRCFGSESILAAAMTRIGGFWIRGIAWGAALLSGCAFLPPLPVPDLQHYGGGPPGRWTIHRITSKEIREPSGLVKSRIHPGVFWTHNDSGDAPQIFAITPRGDVIAKFAVAGARHRDWEDIATDDAGHLYLADFGNNGNARRDLVVYRVPEPNPFAGGGTIRADLALPFRYADQEAFPQWGRWNFDAEALFWMDGALYLFTKHRSDQGTQLYRLPIEPGSEEAVLEPLEHFDLIEGWPRPFDPMGNVTGADLHSDGHLLALLSYRSLYLFVRETDGPRHFRQVRRIPLRTRRTRLAEGVAWDGDDLIIVNEQRYLFRIPDLPSLPPSELGRYPP